MEKDIFSLAIYDYTIPQALIAQEPAVPRDSCRLLTIDRRKEDIKEGIFKDISSFFHEGDILVLNDTKVIKARLTGRKEGGGKIEILLLKRIKKGVWEVLVKPGKRAQINNIIIFEESGFKARIVEKTLQGARIMEFYPPNLEDFLSQVGKVPLPPYIKKEVNDFNDYQTIYARKEGAVAAPTAGLHFTGKLIESLKKKGVRVIYVTLHCSLATFRPVKTEDIRSHKIESETVEISSSEAETINWAKKRGERIIAVGTTSVRALESAAFIDDKGIPQIKSFSGETNLYIVPGYKFKIIDVLITNFHTPRSTNFILVSSFCGSALLTKSYNYAMRNNFRFYSFGDAMIVY